ncbi:hypothetical protein [Aeromonas caviae]|uniref:hypothetical protein n=1 Tax=Aeromonas caviae TaxID=648 RepID=UPI002B24475B|nr:hypothetical protein [Aeromonas caviae]MEA9429274.1 hypothetical protein [Aeromonas caviae]MEA9433917.1 hypothetical protein [Aeromonas caviae]
MEIKKTFTEKVFSREKNNRFPQNNPTIKSKKKRHETLAKNDAIMKKMLRCFGKNRGFFTCVN